MQKCRLSAIAMLWLSTATALFAENMDRQEKPITVTATRTTQTANEALAAMTVISRKDIERQQARSIQDLLRGVPGVNVINNGGMGKATSINMRGTESDHVLVLIDGIKIGSATSGTTSFQNIPIDQIERIEIVRGPRSSLYGSEAIGGVIQIFTRKGGRGLKPNLSFGGGSYQTFNGSVGLSGGNGPGWFNLNASGMTTRGFNSCTGKPSPGGAGCFTDEQPDRDGYRNIAGSLRAGYRFENGLDIETNFLHSDGKTEFDGTFVNNSEIIQQVLGGTARYSPIDIWRISITAGRSREDSDNFFRDALENTFKSRFNTQRDTVSLLNDIAFTQAQLLTLGFDYQNDQINSTEDFAITSRNNFGVFAQHQASLAAHDLQLSLRHDDNEQFGSRVTGGAAWGYALNERLRLTASFGSAYKAPTFNELYFPNFGNAHLQPEESRSYELGTNGQTDWGNWSLHVYETHIDDLIAFDASTRAPANIDQARIRGLEGVLNTQIKGWHLNANLTLLNPENRASGANNGNTLPRRAQESIRFDAHRAIGKFMLGGMLLVEGERYDDLANTRKLESYVKLDLRVEYAFNQNWRIQGRLENLFDKHYETAAFFNQPGRNFFATLRYQP